MPRPPHRDLLDSTRPAALDHAAGAFAGHALCGVVHASTTTGYVLRRREESEFVQRLAQRFHLPAIASGAVAAALRTHDVEKIQLVHPPWFDNELDELGEAYFRSHGFDAEVTKAVTLPENPVDVDPRLVVDWVEHHVQDRAEAVVLAGTGFRAARAIEQLEMRPERLIVEANQALLWGILTATGADWDVIGHGRLLRASSRRGRA